MKIRNKQRAKEMESAISLWQSSRLSKYAFCRQEQIDRTTFNYWLLKFGHTLDKRIKKGDAVKATPNQGSFISIDISESDQNDFSSLSSEVELEYPNGVDLVTLIRIY